MTSSGLTQAITIKFSRGRPTSFTEEEAEHFRGALRSAMAVTLDCPASDISDDALIFDDLGVDSIDVFDIVDQLTVLYEAAIALEELPPELLAGGEGTTFRGFADGILAYYESEPDGASATAGPGEEPRG